MNKVIIGIDVGVSAGCLAACEVNNKGEPVSEILTFKSSEFIDVLKSIENDMIVYVEKLWARPGMSSSTSTTMMKEYGRVIGILQTLEIPYYEIAPMTWQKGIGHIAPLGTEYLERKRLLIARAKEDYPNYSVFQWEADGMLILQYGIKKEKENGKR